MFLGVAKLILVGKCLGIQTNGKLRCNKHCFLPHGAADVQYTGAVLLLKGLFIVDTLYHQ